MSFVIQYSKNEMGILAKAFELMFDDLRNLLRPIYQAVEQLAASSQGLTAIKTIVANIDVNVAIAAEGQRSSAGEMLKIMKLMNGGIQKIVNSIEVLQI